MPLFNFRRAGSSSPKAAAAGQPDSVEIIRKRARHRLIGASVLVLAGVLGFPLLFDTQPRPISVDIPIEIPSRESVKPLVLPAKPRPAKAAASEPAAATPPAKVAAAASLAPKEEVLTEKKAEAGVITAPVAIKKEATPAKGEAGAKTTQSDKAKPTKAPAASQAAAEKSEPAASADGRMVVQVGAFADVAKAREARVKLEKAGLKTYTQVAQTSAGKRIRVRVGPFASRAEAEKAASKIKALDLPAAILTL